MDMPQSSQTAKLARAIVTDGVKEEEQQYLFGLREACRARGINEIGGVSLDDLSGIAAAGKMEDALERERSVYGRRAAPAAPTIQDVYTRMSRGQLLAELEDTDYDGHDGAITSLSKGHVLRLLREELAKEAVS